MFSSSSLSLKNYCCKTKDYYAHIKISRTIILIIKNQGARTLLLWEENNRCPWTSSRPDNKSRHAQSRAWLSTFAISNLSKARSSKKATINLYLLFNSLSNLFLFLFLIFNLGFYSGFWLKHLVIRSNGCGLSSITKHNASSCIKAKSDGPTELLLRHISWRFSYWYDCWLGTSLCESLISCLVSGKPREN